MFWLQELLRGRETKTSSKEVVHFTLHPGSRTVGLRESTAGRELALRVSDLDSILNIPCGPQASLRVIPEHNKARSKT